MTSASFCSEFSPQALMEAADDDGALARELLDIFLRIVPPMTSRLRLALGAEQAAAVADEAHSLRSCLTMVGAVDAGARCKELETAVRRSGRISAGGDALCDDIDRLLNEVRVHRAAIQSAPGIQGNFS